jgi:thiamine biosynthesis lipoprotein
MGGIPIHVVAYNVNKETFERVVEDFRLEVQRVEAIFSVYRVNSVLSKANRSQGKPISIDAQTGSVIQDALRFSVQTHGAFDPTIQPLVELWQKAAKANVLPSREAIKEVLKHVGSKHVHLENIGEQLQLRLDPSTKLDLGGVAKGYMADLGVDFLRKAGISRALVEVGGDLAVYDKLKKKPFRLGSRHPRDRTKFLGYFNTDKGGVVTSGDYERGFSIMGKRYNHIIDPRTGWPAQGVVSVTLAAESGRRADALATGVFVLGLEQGMKLVEHTPEVDAVIAVKSSTYPNQVRVFVSSGLSKSVYNEDLPTFAESS